MFWRVQTVIFFIVVQLCVYVFRSPIYYSANGNLRFLCPTYCDSIACLRFLVSSFIAASLFVYVFRLSGRWEYVGPLFVGRWWNQLTLCSLVDAAVMCCLSPHLFCLFPRSLSMQSQRHSHFQDMFTRIPFSIGLLTFCLVVCARLWVRICPPQAMLF